jgi:hypothetical protein
MNCTYPNCGQPEEHGNHDVWDSAIINVDNHEFQPAAQSGEQEVTTAPELRESATSASGKTTLGADCTWPNCECLNLVPCCEEQSPDPNPACQPAPGWISVKDGVMPESDVPMEWYEAGTKYRVIAQYRGDGKVWTGRALIDAADFTHYRALAAPPPLEPTQEKEKAE